MPEREHRDALTDAGDYIFALETALVLTRQHLDTATTLLTEISDAGYLKTKVTADETGLEERVDACLSEMRLWAQSQIGH